MPYGCHIYATASDMANAKMCTYPQSDHIISDSTLRSLLPPQLKQMSAPCKIMCGCECCISDKSIHSLLLSWRDRYLKKNSRIESKMLKAEGLVRKHITYIQHIKIQ